MAKYFTREVDVLTVVAEVESPTGGKTEVTVYMPALKAKKAVMEKKDVEKELISMYGKQARPNVLSTNPERKVVKCPFHEFVKNSIA